MGYVISKFAFLPPEPTYDAFLRNLFFVESEAGPIPVVFIPSEGAHLTILYCHGNAEDLGMLRGFGESLVKFCNVNFVGFDYPGYGLTDRVHPNERRTIQAVQAVWKHLVYELGISPSSIVLYGRSLGSGPAVHLAAHLCADWAEILPHWQYSPMTIGAEKRDGGDGGNGYFTGKAKETIGEGSNGVGVVGKHRGSRRSSGSRREQQVSMRSSLAPERPGVDDEGDEEDEDEESYGENPHDQDLSPALEGPNMDRSTRRKNGLGLHEEELDGSGITIREHESDIGERSCFHEEILQEGERRREDSKEEAAVENAKHQGTEGTENELIKQDHQELDIDDHSAQSGGKGDPPGRKATRFGCLCGPSFSKLLSRFWSKERRGRGQQVHGKEEFEMRQPSMSAEEQLWFQSNSTNMFFGLTQTLELSDLPKAVPLAGLVIHSGLTSCMRVAFPSLKRTPIDMFENIKRISEVECPTLIVHGQMDDVVPFEHGVQLFERCKRPFPPLWVEFAGHNDIEVVAGPAFIIHMNDFFEMALQMDDYDHFSEMVSRDQSSVDPSICVRLSVDESDLMEGEERNSELRIGGKPTVVKGMRRTRRIIPSPSPTR